MINQQQRGNVISLGNQVSNQYEQHSLSLITTFFCDEYFLKKILDSIDLVNGKGLKSDALVIRCLGCLLEIKEYIHKLSKPAPDAIGCNIVNYINNTMDIFLHPEFVINYCWSNSLLESDIQKADFLQALIFDKVYLKVRKICEKYRYKTDVYQIVGGVISNLKKIPQDFNSKPFPIPKKRLTAKRYT